MGGLSGQISGATMPLLGRAQGADNPVQGQVRYRDVPPFSTPPPAGVRAEIVRLAQGEKPGLDGNLIIEGDNLAALKSLLPTHAGKVKLRENLVASRGFAQVRARKRQAGPAHVGSL